MKIVVAHAANFDYKKLLYLPLRNSPLNAQHEIFLPHEKAVINTKNRIQKSDVVIAEISYPATGLGIELGWANAAGVPIICIYKKGANISDSVRKIAKTFIGYGSADDMIKKLTKHLKAVIIDK